MLQQSVYDGVESVYDGVESKPPRNRLILPAGGRIMKVSVYCLEIKR